MFLRRRMIYRYNDGGRAAAGFRGTAGDCGVRAAAIAIQRPYREIYDRAQQLNRVVRLPKRKQRTQSRSVRNGMHTEVMAVLMAEYGFEWVPTMHIGSGCRVHLRADELPMGRIVARVSKHFVAVIDGVVNDIHDCSRGGTRCVYGYWKQTVLRPSTDG